MAKIKGALDKMLAHLASRKLTAWITSTVLLATGDLQSEQWVTITAIYIGTQGVIDGVAKLRGHTNG